MYKIIQIVNETMLRTTHFRWGEQLWVLAKMRTHKRDACMICGAPVGDLAFRPITNKGNRMERICTGKHLDKSAPTDAERMAAIERREHDDGEG